MSRIRSIHPGLFTDPEFVQVSMTARMMLLGVWTESDDHGVFEWKPLTLKMKLFPADAVDADALLHELVMADRVRRFEVNGRQYGICRNFCKYQRPKKPTYPHPFPDGFSTYIGLTAGSSEPVPHQSPTGGEIPLQMEDGEKDVEEKKEVEARVPRSAPKRGSRLPEDWSPSEEGSEFARKLGLNSETTLAKFRDHWTAASGQTASKLDWDAAWRTWCRKEIEFARNKPSTPAARGAYAAPAADDETRRLAGYAEMIKKRIPPGQKFSSADRFKMIRDGLITMEDCEKAGCAA